MITRVFGYIEENTYNIPEWRKAIVENGKTILIALNKPKLIIYKNIKEWKEILHYEGTLAYNLQINYGYINNRFINISEDEKVFVKEVIFRADLNEYHMRTDKILNTVYVNKFLEDQLKKEIAEFNCKVIERTPELKTYCDLHKLTYHETDCIDLFKLLHPDSGYEIKDGRLVKKEDDLAISSSKYVLKVENGGTIKF